MTVLLFTGHRIDAPSRAKPRFPAPLEAAAARAIAARLADTPSVGVASGANGGDILFHEACATIGVPTHLVSPFGLEVFRRRSVAHDGPGDWLARFDRLWAATPAQRRHIVAPPEGENPYAYANAAMLTLARSLGQDMRLLALWDGVDNGEPGGTSDMIAQARALGAEIDIIHTTDLRGAV